MASIEDLTASDLARRIRARELSSLDALRALQRRIDRINPTLNAIVTPNPQAESAASAADDALARGEVWGPLHGVPITVKDCFATRGLRTTSAYEPLRDFVPDYDATPVARLRAAGAVIIGKTNLPVLASDFQTDNNLFGRTPNPWNAAWTSGGSSGGEGAAIGARLSPLGLGSDSGGSIRNPAHNCAVFGIKPTEHLVSTHGYCPGYATYQAERHLNTIGPLARSIEDLGLALRVIAGPDNRFTPSPPVPLAWPQTRQVKGLRIAFATEWPGLAMSATVRDGVRAFAGKLQGAGAEVEEAFPEVDLVAQQETYGALFWTEFSANVPPEDARQLADEFGARPDAEETMGRGIHRVRDADVRLYLQIVDERDAALRAWESFLRQWDAFIAPVSCVPSIDACPPGTPIDVDGKAMPYWDTIGGTVVPFSLTGHPAVAGPCGFAADGRPYGVQIVGPRWSDANLLDVAEAIAAVACPRYDWPDL